MGCATPEIDSVSVGMDCATAGMNSVSVEMLRAMAVEGWVRADWLCALLVLDDAAAGDGLISVSNGVGANPSDMSYNSRPLVPFTKCLGRLPVGL